MRLTIWCVLNSRQMAQSSPVGPINSRMRHLIAFALLAEASTQALLVPPPPSPEPTPPPSSPPPPSIPPSPLPPTPPPACEAGYRAAGNGCSAVPMSAHERYSQPNPQTRIADPPLHSCCNLSFASCSQCGPGTYQPDPAYFGELCIGSQARPPQSARSCLVSDQLGAVRVRACSITMSLHTCVLRLSDREVCECLG